MRLRAALREQSHSVAPRIKHFRGCTVRRCTPPVMSPVRHVTYSAVPVIGGLTVCRSRAMNASRMLLETKFLRLMTPVTIGSRFAEWRVCWLGGWTKNRLSYIVMLVRVTKS